MHTELFFDDYRIFGREGTQREYGVPERVSEYTDPYYSTDYFSPWVIPKDREYIMLYLGQHRATHEFALLCARSLDGIHFEPMKIRENSSEAEPVNILIELQDAEEPIAVLEDIFAGPWERYKLILTKIDRVRMRGYAEVYASADLIHWKLFLKEIPDWTCEPVGGAFYNPKRDCYTILHRPTWGDRCTGYSETRDFIHYTPYELCLHQDALDQPLDELYGMSAIEYAGMFVGFPMMYVGNAPSRKTKGEPGDIVPQLAYSWDGHHFQRSLRRSFLPDYQGQPSLNWLCCACKQADGSLLLYCAHSPEPHGTAFRNHQHGRIRVYRLRKDGFIRLKAEAQAKVITREFLYHGGPISVNLSAKNATMAIVDTSGDDPTAHVWGTDVTAPGFDHADCVPLSGDSVAWQPCFAGRDLESLKGRVLIFEIKYECGELYSVSGNLEPLTNTQAARFRKTGAY